MTKHKINSPSKAKPYQCVFAVHIYCCQIYNILKAISIDALDLHWVINIQHLSLIKS